MVKTLVGLEIHVELKTETKMFCSCKNVFGAPPNTHVCPTCLGHPGTLPLMNKEAVKLAVKAGSAFHCTINEKSQMDRKKYFYPDLVKGYQITQDSPALCEDGYIEIVDEEGQAKNIRIERIHIEEDTGKSIHEGGSTLLDYDRSGVPLIEIVTRPDIGSSYEAQEFLGQLRQTLKYIGVSDVKMEEGSLRCDVNINLVDEENDKKTGIAEIKNMNSFSAVGKAIDYEVERQMKLLEEGIIEGKNTRRWNDLSGQTEIMRMKDESADYRYTVEGDLPPLVLDKDFIEEIKASIPELPGEKTKRFMKDYGLSHYDADILSRNRTISSFFEEAAKSYGDGEAVANWINSDIMRLLNENEMAEDDLDMDPESLVKIIDYVNKDKINTNTGKKLLREIFNEGGDVDKIIEERGLAQISDDRFLKEIVDKVLRENQESIDAYKSGRDNALKYLMGQCMKYSKGKGNPQKFNAMLLDILGEAGK